MRVLIGMAIEIERKFLVTKAPWTNDTPYSVIKQGYCACDENATVRVRVSGDRATLTLKTSKAALIRGEYEYDIPLIDALEMLDSFCAYRTLTKRRYNLNYRGRTWTVDEFFGDLEGLILAEIELDADDETFDLPDWTGREVTGLPEYLNSSLVTRSKRDSPGLPS